MHEAKTNLSRLEEEAGAPFLICKGGRPMVCVTALEDGNAPTAPRRPRSGTTRLQRAARRAAPRSARWGLELPIEAHHALASVEVLLLITADQQLAQYPAPVRLMLPSR